MAESQRLVNAYLKYINEINQQFSDFIKLMVEQFVLQPMHDESLKIQSMQENSLETTQPALEAL